MNSYLTAGAAVNGNDNDNISEQAAYIDGTKIGTSIVDAKLSTGSHIFSYQITNDSALNTNHTDIKNNSVLEFMNSNASQTPVTITISQYNEMLASQDTLASGVDGTSPWTINTAGVLSFGAGTLNRDQTQDILQTYNSFVTSITTANATGKVVFPADSSGMFKDPNLDESKINTQQITWLENSYVSSSNLVSIDLSNADTSKVTNMSGMFAGDKKLVSLTGLSSFNTSQVSDMSWMFYMNNKVTALDVSGFNTSKVTTMLKMFSWDYAVKALDVSNWNTSKTTNMNCLFQGCLSITSLDVANWNVSNANNIGWMFGDMQALQSLDLSKWVTTKNTSLSRMFWNDISLSSLNVSTWDTSNVIDMSYAFSGLHVTSLDISNWNTSKATNMQYMFYAMNKITELNIPKFNTTNTTNMDYMFANMSSLKTLNIKNMNISSTTSTNNILQSSPAITTLILGPSTKFTATGAADKQWINPTDLSDYYTTTSSLLSNSTAGTFIQYVAPTISSGSSIDINATSGQDLSAIKIPSATAFSYVPNYANVMTVSLSSTPLVSTTNSALRKTYVLNNAFGTNVLNGNLSTVPSILNTSFNSSSIAYPFSTAATINLNALKWGYAGTYQTKITYTLTDGH